MPRVQKCQCRRTPFSSSFLAWFRSVAQAMKIVFNNIIETSLIQADTEMKVHPAMCSVTRGSTTTTQTMRFSRDFKLAVDPGQILVNLRVNSFLLQPVAAEVWVLLTINYFGFIWGPVGMMIGVPILSVLKLATMTGDDWGWGIGQNWGRK